MQRTLQHGSLCKNDTYIVPSFPDKWSIYPFGYSFVFVVHGWKAKGGQYCFCLCLCLGLSVSVFLEALAEFE